MMWLLVSVLLMQPDYCWPGWYECQEAHTQCLKQLDLYWVPVVRATEVYKGHADRISAECYAEREVCEDVERELAYVRAPLLFAWGAFLRCMTGPYLAEGQWEIWYTEGEAWHPIKGCGTLKCHYPYDFDRDCDVDLRDAAIWLSQ